jgi:hypothetical protein
MRSLFGLFLAAILLAGATAADYRPEGVNVQRWARGEIAYRTLDGEETGAETWDLTVHPDGSRTLRATNHLAGIMHTVQLRVERSFRPRELYAEYWIGGAFRNATFVAVRGLVLDITSRFADTTTHDVVRIPQAFSFIPHPLASDVWHGWYYDRSKGGRQTITVYDLDPTANQPFQVGRLYDQQIDYVGNELVTVPAGTFPCDHYRVDDAVDYYVTGPDMIFVKFVWTTAKAEYVLTKLEEGTAE